MVVLFRDGHGEDECHMFARKFFLACVKLCDVEHGFGLCVKLCMHPRVMSDSNFPTCITAPNFLRPVHHTA